MNDRLARRFYEENYLDEVKLLKSQVAQLQKLSAVNTAPLTAAANDVQVGDGFGNWIKKTIEEFRVILGFRERLAADRFYYVCTVPQNVTITIASPGVITWNSHGLAANAAVKFSIPSFVISCTMTIASPAVVTANGHGYTAGRPIIFATTGALPTGVTAGTTYYVIATGLTSNTFQFSATVGGAAVNTSGTQSGSHFVGRTGSMPTGLSVGTIYYVVGASITINTFQVSATPGGAAINTSGTQSGSIQAQTGSDSNDGLTASTAFLTLQHAIDVVRDTLDIGNYNVGISLADGVHLTGGSISGSWVGSGTVTISGNLLFPRNCIISTTSADDIFANNGAIVTVQDLELRTTTSGNCLDVSYDSIIYYQNVCFGICAGSHILNGNFGSAVCTGNYMIGGFAGGGAQSHWNSTQIGSVRAQVKTIVIWNTPAFSVAFAQAIRLSSMIVNGNTYTGGATGVRYISNSNSVIDTVGGGASALPGNSAGSTASGGQYL